MYRVLALLLLVVVGCNRADVVIVPEEIDVCPVLADQLENLLVTIIEFAEEATIDELTAPDGMAADLRRRGGDGHGRNTDRCLGEAEQS